MIVSLNGLSLDIELSDELRELCGSDNIVDIRSYLRAEAIHHVSTYVQENDCQVWQIKDTRGENSWTAEEKAGSA